MKKVIAIIVLSIMVLSVFAGCGGAQQSTNTNIQPVATQANNQQVVTQPAAQTPTTAVQNVIETAPATTSSVALANSEYQEIFTSRYIVDVDDVFFGLDSASFASVDADGMIEKFQFGYEDDIIKEMVDTVYYPVAGMTDSEKLAIDQAIKESSADLEAQSFCTVSYDMGSSWYHVSLHLTDLDNLQNLQVLSQYGILLTETDSNGRVSMSKTETDLLAGGYVKK